MPIGHDAEHYLASAFPQALELRVCWLIDGMPSEPVASFDYATVAAQVVAKDEAARAAWVASLEES